MTMKLLAPYQYDVDEVSRETGLRCEDESLTKQSFVEDADINVLVKRFGLGYEMPEELVPPQYVDFAEVFDFQSAMNAVREAQEAFDAMPADVRSRFNNDPQRLLEFVEDGRNMEEAIRMGLAVRRVEERTEAPVVDGGAPKGAPKGAPEGAPGTVVT